MWNTTTLTHRRPQTPGGSHKICRQCTWKSAKVQDSLVRICTYLVAMKNASHEKARFKKSWVHQPNAKMQYGRRPYGATLYCEGTILFAAILNKRMCYDLKWYSMKKMTNLRDKWQVSAHPLKWGFRLQVTISILSDLFVLFLWFSAS